MDPFSCDHVRMYVSASVHLEAFGHVHGHVHV